MTQTLARPPADCPDIQTTDALVRHIEGRNCTPGWIERPKPLMWPDASSTYVPAHWRYCEIRPALIAAGRVIGTDLAERRNFVLRNPGAGNDFATTNTLVAAYQSILPGERARSHRHSSHAMRIIIESRGSYSVVNGKRHAMESGDIVLTPGGCWHGHGHGGDDQAFWVDCLDLPLVHLLEPMTAEEYPGGWEADAAEDPASPMRISRSDVLARLADSGDGDAYCGRTVDLTSDAMPTIGIKVHRWSAGWRSRPCRQHANQVFVVLGGSGTSHVGDRRFDWSFGDVFVVPLAARVAHAAHEDALIVALNDERLMKFCRYYKIEDA